MSNPIACDYMANFRALTPAEDIDRDFDHLISMCMHSWSEREVVAAVRRLQDKVHEQLQPANPIMSRTPRKERPCAA